jgi:uncharacterized protein (DUF302 family)
MGLKFEACTLFQKLDIFHLQLNDIPIKSSLLLLIGVRMYYIVNTNKDFETAVADLENEVKNLQFGVLHIHDLGRTLRSKGIDFSENCKVLEVCNPKQAAKVLSINMALNTALPCRISVYTENGQTKIGMIKPEQMLTVLSTDPQLAEIAKEVEEKTIQMIENAK